MFKEMLFNFQCSILLTFFMIVNAGDYGLHQASDKSHSPINNELNSNSPSSSGRYVSNGGSYRLTPDDIAVKAYRNLYYKNHHVINRVIKTNLPTPFTNGIGRNNLRINNNGIGNLMIASPSSSVNSKMIPSASILTTSTASLPSTSSHSAPTTTTTTTTTTEKPVLEPIVDPLFPIEGRSSDFVKSKTKTKQSESFQDLFGNSTIFPTGDKIIQDIYGDNVFNNQERQEQLKQMSKWMSSSPSTDTRSGPMYSLTGRHHNTVANSSNDSLQIEKITIVPKSSNQTSSNSNNSKGRRSKNNNTKSSHHGVINKPEALVLTPSSDSSSAPTSAAATASKSSSSDNNVSATEDDEAALMDDEEGGSQSAAEAAGTLKTPPCGKNGRHYCIYREDYPLKVVTEVTRYYKWPLEKLFRDLRNQVMPKLANDNYGGLVCDSLTRVVRPGWARNTNNRWLVVINTDSYQQYVTEVLCRHGSGSYCNFIPPCYHATCRQRYNTQKLLVIDPWNPYKGPFLSEFLFPSCCICHVSDESLVSSRKTVTIRPDGRTKVDLTGPHRSGIVSESSTEKIEL